MTLPLSPTAPLLIVGQGAIALLAASQCALQGFPCYVQGRLDHDATSFSVDFRRSQQNFPLQLSRRPREVKRFNIILMCVKAFDAVAACQQWLPLLADDGCLVLCHNGMGTTDAVAAMLGESQQLWVASTTHGALKSGAHRLVHTGVGQSKLGPANRSAHHAFAAPPHGFIDAIDAALGPIELSQDINAVLWQKLLVNSVINPLTALFDCQNGDLLATEHADVVSRLTAEAVAVAQADGVVTSHPQAVEMIRTVMQRTAENYSSMQQDVAQKRRTELAAITGYVLARANVHAIATPTHQQLYEQLTATLEPWQYQ